MTKGLKEHHHLSTLINRLVPAWSSNVKQKKFSECFWIFYVKNVQQFILDEA